METYMVEYTIDKRTSMVKIVSAKDYTKAYLGACYELPLKSIILNVTKIDEREVAV